MSVSYTYDAWGNQTVTYSSGGATSAAQYNPFRYRGYYYDTETGFYYLNSRYYDPATGRFLNADAMMSGASGSLHGANLYVYCFNNPVNLTDDNGNWPESVKNYVKWAVDNVALPLLDAVEAGLSQVDGTYAKGIGGSVTINHISLGAQFGYAVDTNGDAVLQFTLLIGASSAKSGASFTIYESISNASSVNDLAGEMSYEGVSAGADIMGTKALGGVDFYRNPSNENFKAGSVNYGLGTPGVECHGGKAYTVNTRGLNVFDTLRFFLR